MFSDIFHTFFTINSFLILLIVFLLYKFFANKTNQTKVVSRANNEYKIPLKAFPKQNLSVKHLLKYNGKESETEHRILIAINKQIYDCSTGHKFYGPGGPYAPLAGHDATRALATFDVKAVRDEWDDCSDLTVSEMSSVEEWSEQFRERYAHIGELVE